MSETPESEPTETGEDNPTDAELDLEGPNESAPGHHPADGDADEAAGSPPSAD